MLYTGAVVLQYEFLFETAPFPSCHASTVVETRSGDLVAAWFGGSAESAPDVSIYVSRKSQGVWSPPRQVANGHVGSDRWSCYNPVLFQPSQGQMALFYKAGTGPQTWLGMAMTSGDDGDHWTTPWKLPEGIFGPIKNKPIELADGTVLCGSSEEAGGWRVHFERTRPPYTEWSRTEALNDPAKIGAIQPSILPSGEHSLRALGRTQQGKLFAIDSADDGRSWGAMRLLDVANPNSGTDAVRLRDGRYVLVFNDSPKHRYPLCVAFSEDGEKWRTVLTLETGPGEYSYPAVIQTRDGLVHITYTWRRQRIRHVTIDPGPR